MDDYKTKYDREMSRATLFQLLKDTRQEGWKQLSIQDVAEVITDAFAREEALSLTDMIETELNANNGKI